MKNGQFEVGKKYCKLYGYDENGNEIYYYYTVTKRTATTVTVANEDGEELRRKVYYTVDGGNEYLKDNFRKYLAERKAWKEGKTEKEPISFSALHCVNNEVVETVEENTITEIDPSEYVISVEAQNTAVEYEKHFAYLADLENATVDELQTELTCNLKNIATRQKDIKNYCSDLKEIQFKLNSCLESYNRVLTENRTLRKLTFEADSLEYYSEKIKITVAEIEQEKTIIKNLEKENAIIKNIIAQKTKILKSESRNIFRNFLMERLKFKRELKIKKFGTAEKCFNKIKSFYKLRKNEYKKVL